MMYIIQKKSQKTNHQSRKVGENCMSTFLQTAKMWSTKMPTNKHVKNSITTRKNSVGQKCEEKVISPREDKVLSSKNIFSKKKTHFENS